MRIPGVSKPRRGRFAYREAEDIIPQAPRVASDTLILPDEKVRSDLLGEQELTTKIVLHPNSTPKPQNGPN
jgi:hypothetical protein